MLGRKAMLPSDIQITSEFRGYMNYSLNSSKGGYMGDCIKGSIAGVTKGDTRSLDYIAQMMKV